jgi:hypothetical protein
MSQKHGVIPPFRYRVRGCEWKGLARLLSIRFWLNIPAGGFYFHQKAHLAEYSDENETSGFEMVQDASRGSAG